MLLRHYDYIEDDGRKMHKNEKGIVNCVCGVGVARAVLMESVDLGDGDRSSLAEMSRPSRNSSMRGEMQKNNDIQLKKDTSISNKFSIFFRRSCRSYDLLGSFQLATVQIYRLHAP